MWVKIRNQSVNREFKKLQRLLQRKRHIKIELCVRLSILRLFHVGHVVQNRRSALSLAWYKWFSYKSKEWKIYCCELALLSEPQIWKFHVVVWQTTSKHCTKNRAARAARLFFFIQPIKSLICGVGVDVAFVKSWTTSWLCKVAISKEFRISILRGHIKINCKEDSLILL